MWYISTEKHRVYIRIRIEKERKLPPLQMARNTVELPTRSLPEHNDEEKGGKGE